jgi:hypothetical protein
VVHFAYLEDFDTVRTDKHGIARWHGHSLLISSAFPQELLGLEAIAPDACLVHFWSDPVPWTPSQAERDEGQRSDGLTTEEKQELTRLRRENKALREEREILKRAAAWFVRETGSIPSWSSSS